MGFFPILGQVFLFFSPSLATCPACLPSRERRGLGLGISATFGPPFGAESRYDLF